MSVAMGLGRWTTGKTFLQHYNAPLTLLTDASPPESIATNGKQLLRWGWTPSPPSGKGARYALRVNGTDLKGSWWIVSNNEGAMVDSQEDIVCQYEGLFLL
jgi:hypothetical protein